MRLIPRFGAGAIALVLLGLMTAGAAQAQVTLQNDSFTSGMQVGVQAGFVAGEIGASRFVAPSAGMRLQAVQVFFGGAGGMRDVTLKVWDDSASTNPPGTMLFEGDFTLTASDTALSEIDLSSMNVIVTQQFRVGIEFQHAGVPSIARDDDGTNTAGRNFIFASGQWFPSAALGVNGDWILRAVVASTAPGPDAGLPDAGVSDGGGGIDAPSGGPDSGTTGCQGNADCAIGSFCDPQAHVCTFECRTAGDCGGGACNSLGQCVDGGGEAGGCCSTGTTGPRDLLGALGLAGVVGLIAARRRRR